MVISDKKVMARKRHRCDAFPRGDDCTGFCEPGELYRRLYGAAHKEDPPYVLRECNDCYPGLPQFPGTVD